jgi:hypothetical protein
MKEDMLLATCLPPEMKIYFQKKLPDDEDAWRDTKIAELLKYLYLASISDDDGPILFSREVDDVWHYWILQTRQYRTLCLALPGRRFLNHSSDDYPSTGAEFDQIPATALQNRALQYFCNYYATFGGFTETSARAWPSLGIIQSLWGGGISSVNAFLQKKISEYGVSNPEPVPAC